MTIRRIIGAFLLMPGSFVLITLCLNSLSSATGISILPLAFVAAFIGGGLLCLN